MPRIVTRVMPRVFELMLRPGTREVRSWKSATCCRWSSSPETTETDIGMFASDSVRFCAVTKTSPSLVVSSAIAADAARTMATEPDTVSAVCLFMIVVPLDVCDRPQRGKLSHPEILILIRELSNEHAQGVPQPWAG